jgi:hypothetical protein
MDAARVHISTGRYRPVITCGVESSPDGPSEHSLSASSLDSPESRVSTDSGAGDFPFRPAPNAIARAADFERISARV